MSFFFLENKNKKGEGAIKVYWIEKHTKAYEVVPISRKHDACIENKWHAAIKE